MVLDPFIFMACYRGLFFSLCSRHMLKAYRFFQGKQFALKSALLASPYEA
jgi:hypothetical protein